MHLSVTRVVWYTVAAAFVVFCFVQDRVTTKGVLEYVELHRLAPAGTAGRVTVDDVMRPAVRRSVREGAVWSAAVLAAGFGGAAIVARRGRHG